MSVRDKNMEVLKRVSPGLLARCDVPISDKPEPLESKDGLPVFRYGGMSFHSAYRPEEEGKKFADSLPASAKKVVVFGMGYAYHIKALLAQGKEVTVVEPSPEIFASAVNMVDLSDVLARCRVFVGDDERGLEAEDLKETAILALAPYKRVFGEEWARLEMSFSVRGFLARKRLKVMLVGPIYGGSETTFRYVWSALEKLGAEVVPFDATGFAPAFFRLENITPNKLHLSQLRSLFSGVLSEGVAAMADHRRPDLILVMAQAPLDTPALSRLKALKVPIAFWFVEDFRSLKYWSRVASSYDYFFTIQRGEFFEKLANAGARNVAYLPQAASPDVHRPMEITQEERKKYGSDLSFMGAGYFNRKQFFRGLLDYDFRIWGTEWDLNTPVGKLVPNRNERLKPEEYVKIFNASKINLNLHSSSMLSGIDPAGDFVNPRVFELAACGAFSLVDERLELPPLMAAGEEIETFSSLSELRDKIDFYLANEARRREVAEAGRRRVLRDHTFERRMEQLLWMIIQNEGDSFGKDAPGSGGSRNIVGNMMEEAGDLPELVDFLKQFEREKELSLKDVVERISGGKGRLSRAESIMLMVNQLLVQE